MAKEKYKIGERVEFSPYGDTIVTGTVKAVEWRGLFRKTPYYALEYGMVVLPGLQKTPSSYHIKWIKENRVYPTHNEE